MQIPKGDCLEKSLLKWKGRKCRPKYQQQNGPVSPGWPSSPHRCTVLCPHTYIYIYIFIYSNSHLSLLLLHWVVCVCRLVQCVFIVFTVIIYCWLCNKLPLGIIKITLNNESSVLMEKWDVIMGTAGNSSSFVTKQLFWETEWTPLNLRLHWSRVLLQSSTKWRTSRIVCSMQVDKN